MLFNSYGFLFVFLPICWLGFRWLQEKARIDGALWWLLACSMVFYAYWNPAYVPLLAGSIGFNWWWGGRLRRGLGLAGRGKSARKWALGLGVSLNLSLLAYFKYSGFVAVQIDALSGLGLGWSTPTLPLAISFFTFEQIAYLVDAYRSEPEGYRLQHYGLFVAFFPQLIAGPIVHHHEIIPQLRSFRPGVWSARIAGGASFFFVGLFKKVVLADSIALYATPFFDGVASGVVPLMEEAWLGALAYSCQIYFDFSGYSDMAIGLAYSFGVRLPTNFNSPYQAVDIVDFWRRWHMTLSRFLRDYLYIPLGGNRHGPFKRYRNLMLTMLLGGLWHGAGWTFVVWGGLHGLYLVLNQWLYRLRASWGRPRDPQTVLGRTMARAVTFLLVVIAWVFFRAESFNTAWVTLSSMSGLNGVGVPYVLWPWVAQWSEVGFNAGMFRQELHAGNVPTGLLLLSLLLMVAWLLPNSQRHSAHWMWFSTRLVIAGAAGFWDGIFGGDSPGAGPSCWRCSPAFPYSG